MKKTISAKSPKNFNLLGDPDMFNHLLHTFNHEAGNSLTALISTGSVIEQTSEQQFGTTVVNEAWRLSRLLEFFVLTCSTKPAVCSECDLNDSVSQIIKRASFRRLLGGLSIDLTPSGKPLNVSTDVEQLRLVLNELLRNAFFHLCENKNCPTEVKVVINQNGKGASIVVSNKFFGDSPAALEPFFEPFNKGETYSNGPGLGLTMVAAACERLGIDCTARVTEVNGQKEFHIELIFSEALSKAKAEKAASRKESTIKVLVADDEESIRSAITKLLPAAFTNTEFNFIESTGEDVFELLKAHPAIDLILLDINLRNNSGFIVYKEICESKPQLAPKTVFLSGARGDQEVEAKLNAIGAKYLYKPFEISELTSTINDLISG